MFIARSTSSKSLQREPLVRVTQTHSPPPTPCATKHREEAKETLSKSDSPGSRYPNSRHKNSQKLKKSKSSNFQSSNLYMQSTRNYTGRAHGLRHLFILRADGVPHSASNLSLRSHLQEAVARMANTAKPGPQGKAESPGWGGWELQNFSPLDPEAACK